MRQGSARLSILSILTPCLMASLAVSGAACGGPPASGPTRDLPPYAGHAVDLFDDAIEPAAVGLTMDDDATPAGDRLLRERTQVADAVVRVRIETVNEKSDNGDKSFTLTFVVVSQLTGAHAPPATFTVDVGKSTRAYGIVNTFGERLVSTKPTFVAFIRLFADGNAGTFHFHCAPDSKAEIAAVTDAATLAEMR
jgi:hypothetical protein